jgi:voltage-gated potassium channel
MEKSFKEKLHITIFGTETKAGRNFDLILLVFILLSVLLVMVESVPSWSANYGEIIHQLEWGFTILFTIEYFLRIWISNKPFSYIFSFWGIIDLLSILPTYFAAFVIGYQSIRIVRAFRLLRIFRILQLHRFTSESQALFHSLKASYYRIMVFLFFVVMMTVVAGTLMYVIEDKQNGFDSIPASIYWAIVTVTTVGFGDITPGTDVGKFLASMMMILGYAIIAVPTGLISVEMAKQKQDTTAKKCKECEMDNDLDANYCKKCGGEV